jgi:hypothetical protein
MADPKPDLVREERLLQRAIWRKWNKFIWSGLFSIIIGLVVISAGILFNSGLNPIAALIIAAGVIFVIVGVIRLLIGIINPLSPKDLDKIRLPGE